MKFLLLSNKIQISFDGIILNNINYFLFEISHILRESEHLKLINFFFKNNKNFL